MNKDKKTQLPNQKLDKDGIPKVMSVTEYLGDASGMGSINTISQICMNMAYFYTEKVAIPLVNVSFIMLFSTLIDAFSDLIMGRLFEKQIFKNGKCRPWFKAMIFPIFLAIVLLTLVPNVSPTLKSLYALSTVVFARAVVYTAITIPYFALINYTTKSIEERGKIGNTRTIVNNLITVVFGASIIPVTNLLGGTQKSWIIFSIIIGLTGAILLSICYKTTKERFSDDVVVPEQTKESELSLTKSLAILIKNKYWIVAVIAKFFLFIIFVLQGSALPYYTKWILGNDNLIAGITLATLPAMLLSFIILPFIIKKASLKTTGIVGVVIGLLSTVIRMVNPENIILFAIGNAGVIFATSALNTVLPPMIANTSEWSMHKSGYRLVGMTNSIASFFSKIGAALGSAIMGIVLAISHYNPNATTQVSSAINGINFLNVHAIGICFIIILICLFFYTLEKIYPTLVKENERGLNHA